MGTTNKPRSKHNEKVSKQANDEKASKQANDKKASDKKQATKKQTTKKQANPETNESDEKERILYENEAKSPRNERKFDGEKNRRK